MLEKMEQQLQNHKYYTVGEIGLDYSWAKKLLEELQTDFTPFQKEAFRQFIRMATRYNLPVNIHSRKAIADVFVRSKLNTSVNREIMHTH